MTEGLTPFYSTKNGRISGFDPKADGYRLISEAEWEFLVGPIADQSKQSFHGG